MKDRKLIQRGLLRRAIRRQRRTANTRNAELIQLALDDEALFETLYGAAMSNAKQFGDTAGTFRVTTDANGSPIVDNLLKLLQWFVSNGPQLIEIIQIIVGLFGSVDVAIDACEAETFFVE